MKSLILILFTALFIPAFLKAETVKIKGKIGGEYEIEMELKKSGEPEYFIAGKYKYKGKTAYLTLEGNLYNDDILYLVEYDPSKEVTGHFFLENTGTNTWKGKWTGNSKYFDVEIEVISGNTAQFKQYDLDKMNQSCSSELTGSYYWGLHFLNDMWLEDTGNMEIGYNGGVVSVKEISKDSIWVKFELVCGPTYHIASFEGSAKKTGTNEFVFNSSLYEGEDPCHLIFSFKNKTLNIEQKSSSMDCEFGARAYAHGEFNKIHNKIASDEIISLEDVLGL